MFKRFFTAFWIVSLVAPACTTTGGGSTGADAGVISEAGSGGSGASGGTAGTGSGGTAGTGSGGTGSLPRGTKEPGEPCDETEECVPGSICFNEYCVGSGELRVSLAFSADSDFDLHLETPLGSEIYYGHREADGGTLDVDQCISSCGAGSHVENVVFASAPGGTYTVWVENYDGRSAGSFSIEVAGASEQTFSGSLPATSDAKSAEFTFSVTGAPGGNGGSGGSSGAGGSSGSGGSSSGGSGGEELDCEASCPSEYPSDPQLDSFCRLACCYTLAGDPDAAEQVCIAGGDTVDTSQCNYCN